MKSNVDNRNKKDEKKLIPKKFSKRNGQEISESDSAITLENFLILTTKTIQ
jgi:hypothetical protein